LRKESKLKRWIYYHEVRQEKYGVIFLLLISLAFAISDWTIHYFSFAELIFMAFLPILFLLGQARINSNQMKLFVTVSIIIVLSIGIRYTIAPNLFSVSLSVQSAIKLLFYLGVVTVLFNYIRRNHFEEVFLNINNVLAMVIIIVGLYIMVSIYNGHQYPYRFLWTFTRNDYRSYYFSGNSDFIRMRSVFSEPAHLGYYLMTLITANLLSKKPSDVKIITISFLSIGVFLTFSYSMVITLMTILVMYMISQIIKKRTSWNWFYISIPVIIVAIGIVFRNYIYETFVGRTLNIISGNDGSAFNRLVESWIYIHPETWWIGNGIGHTPPITNNFAYMISDMGIFGLIPFVLLTIFLIKKSIYFGVLFILLNVSRGGYLGPSLWFLMLFIFLYNDTKDHKIKMS
jgi:hypothetical protein